MEKTNMSVLVHFSDLEYNETIIDDETGDFRCDVYHFNVKIGRTMMRCSADVKYFWNEDNTRGYFVDAVFFDEMDKFVEIHDKKFPNMWLEDMERQLRGVCKHSVRLMLVKEKAKYSFSIV